MFWLRGFGKTWMKDAVAELKVAPLTCHEAAYGDLPDLSKVDFSHDVIFPWNGTASGVKVSDGDWIPDGRQGPNICDATSACFASADVLEKLDVVTFSFQKGLGGEGGHGVIILSPRAVAQVESVRRPGRFPRFSSCTRRGPIPRCSRGRPSTPRRCW